jgi:ABC-2 type transport system permease protein
VFATFKYTFISLMRDHEILLWSLFFPIILACIFAAMFSGLAAGYEFNPVELGIVEDDSYDQAIGFDEMMDELSDPKADTQYFNIHAYKREADALQDTQDGKTVAYVTVDSEGVPILHVSPAENGTQSISIVKSVLDSYVRKTDEYSQVMDTNPLLLLSSRTMDAFSSDNVVTEEISVTANEADSSVRYYFSLLAMTAGMAMAIGMIAVQRVQAPSSGLGARRSLSSIPRWKMLLITVLASWLCSFVCIFLAYLFIRFPLGVYFGGSDALCTLAIAVSSFTATAAGALFGTLRGVPTGIVSAITCTLSLFTGLYGQYAQELCDMITHEVPLLSALNPMWEITQSFFSLLYYDSLEPFVVAISVLVIMAAIFMGIAALRMRRKRYDYI